MPEALVVAPQSEVVEIAAGVLRDGGNAFDAAVAGGFAQGVVDSHRSGIGGFGVALYFVPAEGRPGVLSFHGRAGSKVKEDQWAEALQGPAPDGFGFIIRGKENDVGYKSITVPGVVAGLGALHRKYGSLPWGDLVRRAAALARRGFLVRPHLAAFWRRPGLFGRVSTRDRLAYTEEGRRMWLRCGEPPAEGETVQLELLAQTYERLAEAGPDDFYTGRLAKRIAEDLERNGSFITAQDLASYRVRWEEPVSGSFGSWRIFSTPLPGGGTALLQALRLCEMKGAFELRLNSLRYVDLLARVFSVVQDDRVRFHSDPAFGGKTAEELLSDLYLESVFKRWPEEVGADSPDTTVLHVVDRWGNAVALCHSLGYGSGVFTPGLGFMYNNCMSGFDPRPGRANSIKPGKARSTAIAQTMVFDGQRPFLLLGSPGGARITAALAQVISNVCIFGLEIQDAVCRPRFDAYRRTLLLDSRMPSTVEEQLADQWEVRRSTVPFGIVGRVYGIAFTDRGLRPGYDPGEPGTAEEV